MTLTNTMPKWATLDRQNLLVQLFLSSGGFCVFGHKQCLYSKHHYPLYIEELISDWKQIDRAELAGNWEAERQRIHNLNEQRYPVTGRFSAIARDIYHSNQPLYFLEGQSVSGLTLQPFVKVRLSSSYMRLFIDLSDTLRQVSKNRRRKAIRYGKPFPRVIEAAIRRTILAAIRDYLTY